MKKFILLFTAAILMSAVTVQAQQKGDLFIGGNLGFTISSTSIEGYSDTGVALSLAPEVGYFPINNLKIGGQISYSLSDSTHTLMIMPSIGYYVRLCDNIHYTPTFSLGYAYANNSEYGMSGLGLQLDLFSVECKVYKQCALSINALSLSYALLSKNGISANNVTFGLNPTIGFRYYF